MIGSTLIQSIVARITALKTALLDAATSTNGAGALGFLYATAYAGNTVGAWLKGLATSAGSSFIGWLQAGAGTVLRTIRDKLRERVSVLDFGADPTGAADSTAALAAAQVYLAANAARCKLIFPAGIYLYTVSPNWAIANAQIEAEGEVRLRYAGTGNAVILDGGAAGTQVCNVNFGSPGNRFLIEVANSTGQHACFVRALHHSNVCINARSAGAGCHALMINFSVCTDYWITCSGNEGAWYGGNTPVSGIFATRRNAGEHTSACNFYSPVIEGVGSHGIVLDYAIQNSLLGGTSEGNGGLGISTTANAYYNTFFKTDLEQNTGGSINEAGASNSYEGVLATQLVTVAATARNAKLRGGQFDAITGTGTNRTKFNVYNISSAAMDRDQSAYSLAAAVSCPNAVATTVLALPSTGSNWYQISACVQGTGATAAYGAYAVVYQDGASARIVSQTNGTLLTLTLAGQNLQVTQTSGVAQTVTAKGMAFN